MGAIGRQDLARDPALATNAGRVPRAEEIDAAIAAWTKSRARDEVLLAMDEAAVPAGPIHSVADLLADPHVKARGMVERVPVGGHSLALPAIFPRLSKTPGRTEWAGPALDEHAAEVRRDWLGE
jgi:crotonobetainyl-CoA:carnitine CoA-transferase CaiB-like acyl-CoA transferase